MRNLEPGFRVVGSDGKEIGKIAHCGREYCEVDTGILGLGGPIYVPMDAINQTEGNVVFLNVSSERVGEMNWSEPPAGGRESCHVTYAGTMPAEQTVETPPSSVAETELTPAAVESVQPGWPVICGEGKQVGTVASTRPDGLVMDRGWFIFRHQVLVPVQTIERVDDVHHRVYLGVGCATVNNFRRL